MSHFNLENEFNSLLKLDGPISNGPLMRWQRKQNESTNASLVNGSINASVNVSCTKTPVKTSSQTNVGACRSTPTTKTPGKKQTPGRTPGKTGVGSKTPKAGGGGGTITAEDRFIPHRGATQFELGHYRLTGGGSQEDGSDGVGGDSVADGGAMLSPSKRDYQRGMNDNLNGDQLNAKIIAYKTKAPSAPEGFTNNLRVLYSSHKAPSSCKKMTTRHIPQMPERVLDAPELLDDYYLNLLDWSATNVVAVALGSRLYLWNAADGKITQLTEMEGADDYIASVSWVKEGSFLAVGTSSGDVHIYDVEHQKRLRNMTGHASRAGVLAWNSFILSSGSRTGAIHQHDVRIPEHHVATLAGHSQEVCGLQWSPDGRYLASGGNDNVLNVWSAGTPSAGDAAGNSGAPVYSFTQHQAAVKAVAWCPWQNNVLASGGGTADRCIKFWNCNTGVCLNSVDTKSQVCSILWSKEHKELISGHGFADNQLIIWKYPSMEKVTELTGHTGRVLQLTLSPDGTTVMSAAADETLRLWKCFATDPAKSKSLAPSSSKNPSAMMRQSIR